MFADQEYVSSLPLQMALYFNLFYFPFWIVSEIVMLVAKVKWHCSSKVMFTSVMVYFTTFTKQVAVVWACVVKRRH